MAQRVYLETTIPSYLTAWPSRDLVRAAHQRITREWWETRRVDFDLVISQLVLDECAAGEAAAGYKTPVIATPEQLLKEVPNVGG